MSRINVANFRHPDGTSDNININASGAVGIGVTPEQQGAGFTNIQFGGLGNLGASSAQSAGGVIYLYNNVYRAAAGQWNYLVTDEATRYLTSNGQHRFDVAPSGTADTEVSFAEKVRIDTDGLKFNGDTAAANALDDYEEGTWTPTVTTGTLSAGNAVYTKVGRLVTCVAQVSNFSDQSSSNEIYLNNLPFTPAANQVVGSCAIRYYNGPDTVPQVQTNGNMFFTKISNTGNFDTATHSDFNSSNGMIYFVATYSAA